MSRSLTAVAALTVGLALASRPPTARAAEPERPMMIAVDGGERTELPLVASAMHVDVRGPIAQVEVTQTFSNPSDHPIELVYTFPLHQDGAVGAMEMHIGPRVIRAQIRKRDEARAAYDRARREGRSAALLEQERPNIFTQSVANVMPGESIDVALTYDVLLRPEDDTYELALPTVVGPRYIPGAPTGAPPSGTGVRPDTDRVPDASRISPEAAAPGHYTGNTVTLDLDVDAGLPIAAIESPTHPLALTKVSADRYRVALAKGDMVADRDFVLRWRVEVATPTLATLADHSGARGHLALIVQPPPVAAVGTGPRELVFVVDTSGSMSGEPLALAKRGMRYALDRLRPDDSFRILNFSSSVHGFVDGASVPATRDNLRAGLSYVNGVDAEGGTEMLSGIVAALAEPPADGRLRAIVFMTDGYIGNEDEIFAAVKAGLTPDTHLFSFGVGSSVNRHLLDGLARFGAGAAQYLLLDQPPEAQLATFYARLDAPLLHDLHVDWGGLDVTDETPDHLVDLFAGQPLVIAARYGKGGRSTVKVTGQAAGRTIELSIPVTLPERGGDGDVLSRLWARRRIADALDAIATTTDRDQRDALTADVTGIALEHSLLSPWTAFVAIDEVPRAAGQPAETVPVPVELPAGVTPAAGNVVGGDYGAELSGEVITAAPPRGGESYGETYADEEDSDGGGGGDYDEEDALSRAPGERYDVTVRHAFRHRLVPRLSFGAGVGLGDDDGAYASLALGFERALPSHLALGLETRAATRSEQPGLIQLMVTLARLAILRHFDLRFGIGGALTTGGDLGVGWKGELAIPLPLVGRLLPELNLGATGATAGERYVGAGLGVGLRW